MDSDAVGDEHVKRPWTFVIQKHPGASNLPGDKGYDSMANSPIMSVFTRP